MSRLTQTATFSSSRADARTASLPTMVPASSKRTTLGVRISPVVLGILQGRPWSSRWAITEKVVPRSMPTAKEAAWFSFGGDFLGNFGAETMVGGGEVEGIAGLGSGLDLDCCKM